MTQQQQAELRKKTIENYEAKEKELNKELEEKKSALEKFSGDIKLLKTTIVELEKKQIVQPKLEENLELGSCKKELIEKKSELINLNKTVKEKNLEIESFNAQRMNVQKALRSNKFWLRSNN